MWKNLVYKNVFLEAEPRVCLAQTEKEVVSMKSLYLIVIFYFVKK